MSPASLDTGCSIPTPNCSGQVPISFSSKFVGSFSNSNQNSSTDMNPFNFGDLNSGFSSPTGHEVNPGFNSPSLSRSSGRDLSRSRFGKVRKQSSFQHSKPPAETSLESGFNQFRRGSTRFEPGFSISSESMFGMGDNEAFTFRANKSDTGRNSNTSKSNIEKGVFEGMRTLRLDSENESVSNNINASNNVGFEFENDQRKSSVINESMEKLSIDESEKGVEGRSKLNAHGNAKFGFGNGDNVHGLSGLTNELKKKLTISETGNLGGRSFIFNASDEKKSGLRNSEEGCERIAESLQNRLEDRIKTLSTNDSVEANNVCNNTNAKDGYTLGRRGSNKGYISRETETLLSDEMGRKMNIGSSAEEFSGRTDTIFSSSRVFEKDVQTKSRDDEKMAQFADAIPSEFTVHGSVYNKDASCSQVLRDQSEVNMQTVFSSVGLTGGNAFGVPPRPEKTDQCSFKSRLDNVQSPYVEFRTPNPRGNLFSGLNPKPDFGAKSRDPRMKKKRGKLKQPTKVHLWSGQDFVSRESFSQEISEPSYSPMDISPYRETLSESQFSRETSVASEESVSFENPYPSTDSQPTDLNNAVDEDLLAATERMDINEEESKCREEKYERQKYCFEKGSGTENNAEESISGAETESFKSANEELDLLNDSVLFSSENESCSITNIERQDSGIRTQFASACNSDYMGGSGFTFAASYTQQASSKHQPKKKAWVKGFRDSSNVSQKTKVPYASASLQFTSPSAPSLSSSPERGKKVGHSVLPPMVGDNSEVPVKDISQESDMTSDASLAAQEACEKWRLRGNQAYKNGDLSKAEDCYTQGLNCVSKSETSRSCLRALVLCYSNRAATRMSLGRMRDALDDCQLAAAIDPNFLRVQVRAANCYLALGEVEDALEYFKKCLWLGSDGCVDRKIALEASEGLEKAERVSELMLHSTELLQRRAYDDAGRALEVLDEALATCPYSEKLLEMKAESLFMLRKYEESIQLCEQTLDATKKNYPSTNSNNHLPIVNGSALTKDASLRFWRCNMIFRCYFYLGKLEEAISSLENQEGLISFTRSLSTDSKALESLIPLAATVRELLRRKTAGNEAFQAGRHSEAIEHYTVALSRNVESRPFTAICFCNRAAAYKALGQITDAIADCSLAIALDGNYLKAISRRATLYEMIRDYGQAASDLGRLVTALTKQVEEKANQSGSSDRSKNLTNDLRQARLRLSTIEEEARKEIPLDMYLILGVEPSASASEIKRAYRKAALRHHPDKAGQSLARSDNGDDRLWKEIGEEVHKDADRLFKMIGEAYAVLSDPNKRSQYDLEEEMRNAQKKRNGSGIYKTHTDAQSYPFERSNSRRQWTEVWRSYGR
ncbi:hypothetical protein K2173_016357 [Erythroxylum novogranatense]|uniref:J domain-containing protein n=1 Tax=Erythroxylum novogranatense TaxID=1862640 RepID=A0AAV8SFZ9_9ROSI|nr:hypothetical protein K2173_016357 [Erythroxylum novogranatense]